MAIGIAIRLRYLVVRLSVCINTWSLDDPVQQWILIEKKKLKWNYNKRHLKREEEEEKKELKTAYGHVLGESVFKLTFKCAIVDMPCWTCCKKVSILTVTYKIGRQTHRQTDR